MSVTVVNDYDFKPDSDVSTAKSAAIKWFVKRLFPMSHLAPVYRR